MHDEPGGQYADTALSGMSDLRGFKRSSFQVALVGVAKANDQNALRLRLRRTLRPLIIAQLWAPQRRNHPIHTGEA